MYCNSYNFSHSRFLSSSRIGIRIPCGHGQAGWDGPRVFDGPRRRHWPLRMQLMRDVEETSLDRLQDRRWDFRFRKHHNS